MQYLEVFKISGLTNHLGQELKPVLSMEIRNKLVSKGFIESENSFKIPLQNLLEVSEWKSVLPVVKNNVA